MSVLQTIDLKKYYGTEPNITRALDGVNFSVEDGEFVDVEDLARTTFLLEMDTKMLCSQDCKGLCPRCGADLNLGPCFCKKELDPRMAILATLLENEPNE